MFCVKCGNEFLNGDIFCSKCGNRLRTFTPSTSIKNSGIGNTSLSAADYVSRGLTYDQKGDSDRAIADYSEAIRLTKLGLCL